MTNKKKKLIREYAKRHNLSYQAAFNRVTPKTKEPPQFLRLVMDDGRVVDHEKILAEAGKSLTEFSDLRLAWDEGVAEHGEEEMLRLVKYPCEWLYLKARICWMEFDDGVRVPWPLGGEKRELSPEEETEQQGMLGVLWAVTGKEFLGFKAPVFSPLPSVYD